MYPTCACVACRNASNNKQYGTHPSFHPFGNYPHEAVFWLFLLEFAPQFFLSLIFTARSLLGRSPWSMQHWRLPPTPTTLSRLIEQSLYAPKNFGFNAATLPPSYTILRVLRPPRKYCLELVLVVWHIYLV